MKNITLTILCITLLASLAACKNKKSTMATNTVETAETAEQPSASDPMKLVIDRTYSPDESASITMKSVSIEGDILSIVVSYSGGCKDHGFRLISTQKYMKSLPPQLNLYLEHKGNGDMCRELIEQTLTFDVSGAQYGGHDSVKLIVNGDQERTVLYSYKNK